MPELKESISITLHGGAESLPTNIVDDTGPLRLRPHVVITKDNNLVKVSLREFSGEYDKNQIRKILSLLQEADIKLGLL